MVQVLFVNLAPASAIPRYDCCYLLTSLFVISRRALAREGDYEMMPVCACVRACVRALVSHADSSKTTTATDFL